MTAVPWTLLRQREAVLGWFESADSIAAARHVARGRGLPADAAEDLVNESWIRARTTFANRSARYDDIDDDVAAGRYARRVLANAAIDRVRSGVNRHEVSTDIDHQGAWSALAPVPHLALARHTEVGTSDGHADWHQVALRWREAVATQVSTTAFRCPGCPQTLVVAVALYVCNALAMGLGGSGRGQTELDALIYDGLIRHDPTTFAVQGPRTTDHQRQRKSRCGKCVATILRSAALSIGMEDE